MSTQTPAKRTRSLHACDRCARLKKKCSGQQPCEKCVRSDLADACTFSPQSYGQPKLVPSHGISQPLPPLSTITQSLPQPRRPNFDDVETFLTSFVTSTDPSVNETFPSPLHADAQLVMGDHVFFGHGAILGQKRPDAWHGVRRRRYFVDGTYDSIDFAHLKVPDIPMDFENGRRTIPRTQEHVLHGTVDLETDDGSVLQGVSWAGKMVVCPNNHKIVSYQVYIDK